MASIHRADKLSVWQLMVFWVGRGGGGGGGGGTGRTGIGCFCLGLCTYAPKSVHLWMPFLWGPATLKIHIPSAVSPLYATSSFPVHFYFLVTTGVVKITLADRNPLTLCEYQHDHGRYSDYAHASLRCKPT